MAFFFNFFSVIWIVNSYSFFFKKKNCHTDCQSVWLFFKRFPVLRISNP
ncbi:hypothetical protein GLYMA_19G025051v4 [Glycine max]|nr:hypothetical protein GLYMA_19G025051v4 [Glycine max]KAH1076105.1 hypothetical protein GYH30_051828 [Glycine max]